MNFFKSIAKYFTSKDELIGDWQSTDEGGFQMLAGAQLVLNEDGTGINRGWGSDENNEPFNFFEKVIWKRVDKNRIAIKREEYDKEFQIVEYVMEEYEGQYKQQFDMIYEPKRKNFGSTNLTFFWTIPYELYRKK